MSARSYLYVPADAAEKLAKALTRGADALIVDLEDAVALPAKPGARETLAAWLDEPGDPWVLVTCSTDYQADGSLALAAVDSSTDAFRTAVRALDEN